MKKIIFILDSITSQNGIKRIDEFYDKGYDVIAFGFDRKDKIKRKSEKVAIKIVDSFTNDVPYKNRIHIIYKGIKSILKITNRNDCVYYLVGPNVGMTFSLVSNRKYIYEEEDMPHTYIKNKFIKNFFEKIDKHVIRKSTLSVFTSEGFIHYHFGNNTPNNVIVIPNRLNNAILSFPTVDKDSFDIKHIKFGFVGSIRFDNIYLFAHTICEYFPQHEIHFFGTFGSDQAINKFKKLERYSNCFFYGRFNNPDDLPQIYSKIDFVLSTYDVNSDNVRCAEPNKLYESLYFKTPIIVSKGTFLSEKVQKLGIGFSIEVTENNVLEFLNKISMSEIKTVQEKLLSYPPQYSINNNVSFFEKFSQVFSD